MFEHILPKYFQWFILFHINYSVEILLYFGLYSFEICRISEILDADLSFIFLVLISIKQSEERCFSFLLFLLFFLLFLLLFFNVKLFEGREHVLSRLLVKIDILQCTLFNAVVVNILHHALKILYIFDSVLSPLRCFLETLLH